MAADGGGRHLLHVFSTFAVGGPQIRFIQLANRLGRRYRHTVLAMDGDVAAAERLDPTLDCAVRGLDVVKGGAVSSGNLRTFRRVLAAEAPDLLLTYNWGSIEWALANRLPPSSRHFHFEDGFGPDEASGRQIPRRVWMRRLALTGGKTSVIVPSQVLHGIATRVWRLSPRRVIYIPNGIDCDRFAAPAGSRRDDPAAPVIGTVGALRAEKNLGRLLAAVAALAPDLRPQVVIVGDGPARPGLEEKARSLGLADRVRFTGRMSAPETILPEFDIFAMSSDTEQMPVGLIEAMAAGRPVVATDVGDIRSMVAEANRPHVVPLGDEAAYGRALEALLRDPALRTRLGADNAVRARATYDEATMVATYDRLFAGD